MKKNEKMLLTMDEICTYAGRNKRTIKRLIKEEGFPAIKTDGRWESNTDLIDSYQRERIRNGVKCEA